MMHTYFFNVLFSCLFFFFSFLVVRTESDKKGGHLAKRKSDGQFILRESAQCAKEDESAFQDTDKHKFFNTNNLWVR